MHRTILETSNIQITTFLLYIRETLNEHLADVKQQLVLAKTFASIWEDFQSWIILFP